MTKNNQLEKQEIKRPWQGIVLVVVSSFLSLFAILVTLTMLVTQNYNMLGLLINLIFLSCFIILALGFYKGWKFTIFLMFIFLAFSIYGGISQLMKGKIEDLITFCFLGFFIYLSISCLKHPFYNQKKVK